MSSQSFSLTPTRSIVARHDADGFDNTIEDGFRFIAIEQEPAGGAKQVRLVGQSAAGPQIMARSRRSAAITGIGVKS